MLFKDVIGHEVLKRKLREAVGIGRVSHAQLFLESEGTGGLAMALAYAQYVNCTDRHPEDSCNVCDSCRRMQSLEHPDLHFTFPTVGPKAVSLDFIADWRKAVKANPYLSYTDWLDTIKADNKQGNITSEECLNIVRALSLKPMYDGYKIYIIFHPESLAKNGNKLLKILEEPAPMTLFLLVAESEGDILPTILSRTQMVRIPRIADTDIHEALERRHQVEPKMAGEIARLSEGNYAKARELIHSRDESYAPLFIDWMRACYGRRIARLLKFNDEVGKLGREGQKSFLEYGLSLMRQCYLRSHGAEELLRLMDNERDFVEKFYAFTGDANIEAICELFNEYHYMIERNGNARIVFFDLSLKMNVLLHYQKQMGSRLAV